MEQAAAGPTHTPGLYSCFLRALLSAKTNPSEPSQAIGQTNGHGTSENAQVASNMLKESAQELPDPFVEFNIDSEMGPVADISTFPPTMAPQQAEDTSMLSMDSILSTNFWDSVLVPGENFLFVVC